MEYAPTPNFFVQYVRWGQQGAVFFTTLLKAWEYVDSAERLNTSRPHTIVDARGAVLYYKDGLMWRPQHDDLDPVPDFI